MISHFRSNKTIIKGQSYNFNKYFLKIYQMFIEFSWLLLSMTKYRTIKSKKKKRVYSIIIYIEYIS